MTTIIGRVIQKNLKKKDEKGKTNESDRKMRHQASHLSTKKFLVKALSV
jgi:hypothetical protein